MAIEYFCCYHSYLKKCEKLTDQELGRLFRALLAYSATGQRQELAGRESIAFDFIADDIDRAKENYSDRCQRNAENGKKGGRPTASKKPSGFSETEKSQNKDKNKDENKNKKENSTPGGVEQKNAAAAVDAYLDKINPTPSEATLRELEGYAQAMGTDCCLRAFDAALDEKKTSWSYIRAILRSKREQGVRCLADWDRLEEERNGRKRNSEHRAGGDQGEGRQWGLDTLRL